MDFKDFKKVGVTKSHTIFEHPEGHVIHVAHEGIPQKLKNEMRQIQTAKMKDGGRAADVAEEQGVPAQNENQLFSMQSEMPSSEDRLKQLAAEPIKTEAASVPVEQLSTEEVPEDKNVPLPETPKQQAVPAMPEIGAVTAIAGGAQQVRGEQALGAAEAASAKAQQAAATQSIQDFQNFQKNILATRETYRKRVEDSVKAMSEHPDIDPNRYLGQMGTGKKILTAIGLVLGGMGSGLAGGPNQALEFLKSTIDKDIEAQKLGLEKKNTIYKANLQMLKDEDAAADMTRLQMLEMSKLKMQQAALASSDKAALARHQIAAGQLIAAQEGPLNRLAQSQVMNQMAAQPMQNPAIVRSFIGLLPSGPQKEASKEYDRYNDITNTLQTVVPRMEQIANLGIAGKAFSLKERADIQNLNKQLISIAGQLSSSPDFKVRLSPQTIKMLTNPYTISPYSFKDTDIEKLNNLKQALGEALNKSSSNLKGFRINVPGYVSQMPIQTVK